MKKSSGPWLLDIMIFTVLLMAFGAQLNGSFILRNPLSYIHAIISFITILIMLRSLVTKNDLHEMRPYKDPINYVVAVCITVQLVMAVLVPDFGWDALDWWLQEASDFVDCGSSEGGCMPYENRHPPTLPVLYAADVIFLERYLDIETGESLLNLRAFLLLSWCVYLLVIIEFGRRLSLQPRLIAICLLSAVGLPLLENHIIIKGYSEFYVGVFLSISMAYLLRYSSSGASVYFILAISFAVMPASVRNTGFVYSICALLAIFVSQISIRNRTGIFWLLCLGSFAVWLYLSGFDLRFLETRLSWMPDKKLLAIGGREIMLIKTPISSITTNFSHAFFNNISYSVSILTIAICSMIVWQADSGDDANKVHRKFELSLFGTVIGIFIILSVSQFFDHGMRYAQPDSDTGNSRFHLPAVMLIPMIIMLTTHNIRMLDGRRKTNSFPISQS